ncbi:hypothetical protein H6G41_30835 [Tolypothrix sp. FACHB-123]|uniref:hypothetical protein n=1 Tax=Tolypothrix sp. FACHB-123 TaxID=2692868 RepID=UPI0016838994|nr:hypothetical protein [Tolypothrix sp. FACHB-123]MBD2358944.1 hypothetical protein [Tolypothrix sp. FACHB-123]
MLTNNQKTPIYFDAELVDDSKEIVDKEQYDSEQVQEAIAETDSSITVIRGIAQSAVMAGFQVVSTQSLYLAGSVGLFPAVVAGLPVGASFAGTLCYLRFSNSVIPTITNRQKFAIGVTRTAMLMASSWKLTSDAQNMDSIARGSFSVFTQQVREFEGIRQPSKDNFGLLLGFSVFAAIALLLFLRKK